ncbi:MAG TPA: hypothetical protein VHC68_01820 [Candidatus Paceibacterota bacterium]|nr:hypothetical protein [Candidatus Paceibacterota bacterium]
MRERHRRSIAKGLTWRLLATLDTLFYRRATVAWYALLCLLSLLGGAAIVYLLHAAL